MVVGVSQTYHDGFNGMGEKSRCLDFLDGMLQRVKGRLAKGGRTTFEIGAGGQGEFEGCGAFFGFGLPAACVKAVLILHLNVFWRKEEEPRSRLVQVVRVNLNVGLLGSGCRRVLNWNF